MIKLSGSETCNVTTYTFSHGCFPDIFSVISNRFYLENHCRDDPKEK